MGYSITIGEAYIETPDCKYDYDLRVCVDGCCLDEAPEFPGDSMTGKSSSRSPSYSGWSEFVRAVGLHGMFFDQEKGLMRQHPGTCMLHPNHAYQINVALLNYRAAHPNAKPGWCDCKKCDDWHNKDIPHEELDGNLARLMWLDFWVKWAITNCKIPAIRNT